jgi:hypothetical protein
MSNKTMATSQARRYTYHLLSLSPPGSGADWLGKLQGFVKLATAAGGLTPFPFIKTVGVIMTELLQMLEVSPICGVQTHSTQSSQTMKKNEDDL